jgi:hypothetical protein
MTWQNKRLDLDYGPTVGRDGHVVSKSKRTHHDELRPIGRQFTDEQMALFDRKVDAMELDADMRRVAKRTLRKMQGLPYDDAGAGVDSSVLEALRRLAREFA